MKKLVVAVVLAATAMASAASAQPSRYHHLHCTMRHHHRVCHR